MGIKNVEESFTQDERYIQALIARWARAVREEDRAGIRADHDSDMLMSGISVLAMPGSRGDGNF